MAKINAGIEIKAFDKVTAPLRKINASLESIRAPVRRLNNSFAALSAAAGLPQLRRAFGNVATAAGRVGREVMALGRQFLIFGGLAAAGIWKAITSTSEAADRLAKLSKATGMSVESIQTLGFAFEQSGGTADQFQSAVGEFATKLGQARNGAGRMASMLKKIDPALLSTMRKATDTGEAFRAVFAGIARAKTDSERMALATAAFGQGAAIAVVNLAKEGEAGLARLEDEMRRMGITTGEEAKAAEAFNDAWNGVSRSFSALKNKALLPLMPVLTDLSRALQEWFIGKQEAVAAWGRDFAEKLPQRLELIKGHLKTLRDFLAPLGRAMRWVASDSDRLKFALGVLAVLVSSKLLISLAGLAKGVAEVGIALPRVIMSIGALTKSLAVFLWTNPAGQFLLIAAGVYAWRDAILMVWNNWDAFVESVVVGWNRIKSALGFQGEGFDKWGNKVYKPKISPEILKDPKIKEAYEQYLNQVPDKGSGKSSRDTDTGRANDAGGSSILPDVSSLNASELVKRVSSISKDIQPAINEAFAKQGPSKVAMVVDFKNVPQGVRVSAGADKNVDVTTKVSYLGIQGAPA